MTSNYGENQSDAQSSPEPSLPRWNTWTNRSILKGTSGVLIALAVFPVLLSLSNPYVDVSPASGILLLLGIIAWAVYYQMEMEYRKVTPDRIR